VAAGGASSPMVSLVVQAHNLTTGGVLSMMLLMVVAH